MTLNLHLFTKKNREFIDDPTGLFDGQDEAKQALRTELREKRLEPHSITMNPSNTGIEAVGIELARGMYELSDLEEIAKTVEKTWGVTLTKMGDWHIEAK